MSDDAPKVAFEPCPLFRIPLEGDLLTCRDCRYWIEDHSTPGLAVEVAE